MKRTHSFYITILLLILSLFNHLYSKSFTDISYQIANFESPQENVFFLDSINTIVSETRSWKDSHFGMSIVLDYDETEGQLYLSPISEKITFNSYLKSLRRHLETTNYALFPLFISFDGIDQNIMETALEASEIIPFTYYHQESEKWPKDISHLESEKKSLVIFSFTDLSFKSDVLNSIDNHISDLPFTSFEKPQFDGTFNIGTIQNELLMIRHFTAANERYLSLNKYWDDFNTQMFIPNYILKCWLLTGKRPNFTFFRKKEHIDKMMWIEFLLNQTPAFEGEILSSGKTLETLRWIHSDQCITNHTFSFPMVEDKINFSPLHLGYKFTPSTIHALITDDFKKKNTITATSCLLEENLQAYYPFTNNFKNYVNKKGKVKNDNCSIVSDTRKGNVLKIDDKSSLTLSPTNSYGIINNSLTIAFDYKIIDIETRDAIFVATEDIGPRLGLHTLIRNSNPCAGFYNEDIVTFGNKIRNNRWYHFVFRYEILTGEQTLFVDGQVIATSSDHDSFLGQGNIVLGKGIGLDSNFEGCISKLCIWNRALANSEITILFNKGVETNNIKSSHTKLTILILIIGLLALSLMLAFLMVRSRITKKTKSEAIDLKNKVEASLFVPKTHLENTLLLFGNFTALDHDANDISKVFTPRIKELFLLIFFFTRKANRGISSQQLSDFIWGSLEPAKATNNRGVAFNKLRHALDLIDGVTLNFENDYWNISFSSEVFCDFNLIRNHLDNIENLTSEDFAELFHYIKRGDLLHRLQLDWLDEFKTPLMYDIADALIIYCNMLKASGNDKELSAVAKHVLSIDDLNEHALQYYIFALTHQGNLSKAKYVLDNYKKRYKESYGTEYQGYSI